ncbi:MAG: extracellular solute-binding protein, partial [Phycisphaeraceae bacterium]|nr:extracellular solute-binding protein [Phycisphaeraceae bacterium]
MTLRHSITAAASAVLLAASLSAGAGTLVINADTSDPAPKEGFEKMIAKFKEENPDIEVKFNVFDHEGFKTAIRNFLTSAAPDVVTWYAGERMKSFVDRGLFEDVSDLWEKNNLKEAMPSAYSSMTVNGKQYGIPYTYYQWGVYYRKDIFEQHGLQP